MFHTATLLTTWNCNGSSRLSTALLQASRCIHLIEVFHKETVTCDRKLGQCVGHININSKAGEWSLGHNNKLQQFTHVGSLLST